MLLFQNIYQLLFQQQHIQNKTTYLPIANIIEMV